MFKCRTRTHGFEASGPCQRYCTAQIWQSPGQNCIECTIFDASGSGRIYWNGSVILEVLEGGGVEVGLYNGHHN